MSREHGTKANYHVGGCRCDPCRAAAVEYGNHRSRQIAYGRWEPYVDAEAARQHVIKLRTQGLGPVTLARLSGVPHGALAKLVYGDRQRNMAPSRRIRRETADRILAVEANMDTLAPGALMDATGTRRRAQALAALGWSLSEQARRMGLEVGSYHRTVNGEGPSVQAGRARVVRALYDELSMTPGPSNRTREIAARKGWPPPLAFDDDTIDDPDVHPHGVGYLPPDRATALADLDALGLNITEVCRRLDLRRDNLERWCQRRDMADLYRRLVGREVRYTSNQHVEAS